MNTKKFLFADLHLHSKYSQACSKDLDFPNLVKWARIKGLDLLGSGDFTHPLWLKEIKKLKENKGIYYYIDDKGEFPFLLSSEISLVYSKNNRVKKIHLLYFSPSVEVVEKINSWLDEKGKRDYDGRPIFGISCRDFVAKMEEIDSRIEVIPAHAWTPWFGIFGSEGGFDSLKEAFEDKTYLIHAIETGISSDPEMNWRIKELDDRAIVSFSDSHSYWPWRLGREATIFNLDNGELSYESIINQIREKKFFGTIEVDPAYGKYHFDGHAKCNFSCTPEETKKINGICPVCKNRLTIGVDYRVNEISKLGLANHRNKKFYYKILPLHELISLTLGVGINTKKCWDIYNNLINNFSNELNVLLNVEENDLKSFLKNDLLAEVIIKNRKGEIKVIPGYDGVYGKAILPNIKIEKQKKLF